MRYKLTGLVSNRRH